MRVSQHSTPSTKEARAAEKNTEEASVSAAGPPGRKKANAKRKDDREEDEEEATPPPAKRSRPVSAQPKQKRTVESPLSLSESDSEDDKRSKNNRYKSVKCSDILNGQVVSRDAIGQIRHHFQMAVIARDGMNLQDGAGNRQLNFHQVLCSAKAAGLQKDISRAFCKAMQDARAGGKDDQ